MNLGKFTSFALMTVLVAALAACAPVQAPGAGTEGGSPVAATAGAGSTATPAAAEETPQATTVAEEGEGEATPAATEEAEGEATPAATEEAEGEATPAATAEATEEGASGTTQPGAGVAVTPLESSACEAVQTALADRIGVDFTMEDMAFDNAIVNRQGTACTLTATGTGEDFGNFVDVAQSIRELLMGEGWTENMNYLADAPTGTASGYERTGELAVVTVNWEPSEDADCPDDQPISDCNLEPSQQLFTVTVELVQTGE